MESVLNLYVLFRTYLCSVPPASPPSPDLLVTVPPDLPVHLPDRRSLHAGVCNLTRQDEAILILQHYTACQDSTSHGRHGRLEYLKLGVTCSGPLSCCSLHSEKKTSCLQCHGPVQLTTVRASPAAVHAPASWYEVIYLHCHWKWMTILGYLFLIITLKPAISSSKVYNSTLLCLLFCVQRMSCDPWHNV